MTKTEFRRRWESDDEGGGITFDDIAECAIEWGVDLIPRAHPIVAARYAVLVAAGVADAEEYRPEEAAEEAAQS